MRSLRKFCRGGLFAAGLTLALAAAEPASVPHQFLEELCDRFGPRLTGSPGNAAALEHLAVQLRALGYTPERREFTMPGWERGVDAVEVIAPFRRSLRVAALGYVNAHPAFTAELVDIRDGRPADYPTAEVRGKVGVLAASTPLQTREVLANAAARGLAVALDPPLSGIATTDVLLAQARSKAPGRLGVAAIDSRLGDWFCALDEGDRRPFIASTAQLAERLSGRPATVVGPDAERLAAMLPDADAEQGPIDPRALARLASEVDPSEWRERNRREGLPRPLYLRGVSVTSPDVTEASVENNRLEVVVGPDQPINLTLESAAVDPRWRPSSATGGGTRQRCSSARRATSLPHARNSSAPC